MRGEKKTGFGWIGNFFLFLKENNNIKDSFYIAVE